MLPDGRAHLQRRRKAGRLDLLRPLADQRLEYATANALPSRRQNTSESIRRGKPCRNALKIGQSPVGYGAPPACEWCVVSCMLRPISAAGSWPSGSAPARWMNMRWPSRSMPKMPFPVDSSNRLGWCRQSGSTPASSGRLKVLTRSSRDIPAGHATRVPAACAQRRLPDPDRSDPHDRRAGVRAASGTCGPPAIGRSLMLA